ncbi:hypothetical protein CAEBREN_08834 [Caenorhabditis brenneri]|uniref:SXP/RAL-2 family protein Ani s 5-like cation-binding domain-containing protein n=1 Tax=Caenorhabditis brenneri TaxID=135651 RepID=G0MVT3_CAEBE|nr:hypothetical protein CAEBREN_08834 [Caenorhabditis brenneri]
MLKLKLGALLLLLLIIHQSKADYEDIYSSPNFKKATAKVTTEEEWKEVNATVDYATALLSSNNAKLSEIEDWGKELMDEVNRLHFPDEFLLYLKENTQAWEYSHFQLCTAMELNETSKYYAYKKNLTNYYRHLYGILERMPNTSGIDLKRLNKYFSYISNEATQLTVKVKSYFLVKHLQCLQNVISSSDKFVMDDIQEVYESYQFESHLYLKTINKYPVLPKWIFSFLYCYYLCLFAFFVFYK